MPFDFPNESRKDRPAKKRALPVIQDKKVAQLASMLDDIQVAAPCDADWNDMSGDEQVRFCGLCSKNVYNFSDMSRDAIATLLLSTEGRVCGRFYKREDGTLLTSDCPVGLAERSYRMARRSLLAALALVGVLFSALFSFLGADPAKNPVEPLIKHIEQSQFIKGEGVDELSSGGLRMPEPEIMGDILIALPAPQENVKTIRRKTMGKIRLPQKQPR